MVDIRNIVAVIDPTTDNQRALSRAARIAERHQQIKVHAYLCIHALGQEAEDMDALRRVEIAKHEAWLENVIQPYRERGIDVDFQIDWDRDWREALGPAAAKVDADMIVKSSYRHSGARRHLLKTSDWRLLRTAPCPVFLVKQDQPSESGKLIAAVNIAARDDKHQKLNEAILEYSRMVIAQLGNGELHAVNAHRGSEHFIYPEDLAKRCGIERAHAHVADEDPERLIAEVAEKIDAEMVVIGTVARTGIAGAMVGNTAERVLDHLDVDVLAVVAGI